MYTNSAMLLKLVSGDSRFRLFLIRPCTEFSGDISVILLGLKIISQLEFNEFIHVG